LCAPVADSVERHREAAIAQVAAGGDFVRDALPVEQSTRDGSARPTALRSTAGALRRILAVALCGLALGTPAAPAEAEFDEQRVMAAFLFNFVKFVSWPEDAYSGPDASIEIKGASDTDYERSTSSALSLRFVNVSMTKPSSSLSSSTACAISWSCR
jgi:hypothetical protein